MYGPTYKWRAISIYFVFTSLIIRLIFRLDAVNFSTVYITSWRLFPNMTTSSAYANIITFPLTRSSPISVTIFLKARLNNMGEKTFPGFYLNFTSKRKDSSLCHRTLQNVLELHILIILINLFGIPRFNKAVHN